MLVSTGTFTVYKPNSSVVVDDSSVVEPASMISIVAFRIGLTLIFVKSKNLKLVILHDTEFKNYVIDTKLKN